MDAVDQAPVPMVTRSGQGRGVKKTRKGKTYTHDQDSSRLPPATDKALIECEIDATLLAPKMWL
eukprot:7217265-Lingulodinium_polyedra.AAC.1